MFEARSESEVRSEQPLASFIYVRKESSHRNVWD